MNDFQSQIDAFASDYQAVVGQLGRVLVGMDETIDQVLTCLLTGGHGLLEGAPGLGKTLLIRTLADVLELEFSRIQFTPDLMPADITGTMILSTDDAGRRAMRFEPGPIFANLVLADEINRATPKTQSAILEAMQEQTVSVARTTHALPRPLTVLATQNPIEMEGTYPLPEAQLDRFVLKIVIAPPSADDISTILDRTTGASLPDVHPVADAARIEQHKQTVRQVTAAEHVRRYAAELVSRSHPEHPQAPGAVRDYVRYGASPRGAQAMLLAGKVAALRDGRANVSCDDIAHAALPALRHRLILNFDARADDIAPANVIRLLLNDVPQ
jgi:MoxR-like ATPase